MSEGNLPDRNAKKYNNLKLLIGISKGIISFTLLTFFVVLGYSLELEQYLSSQISNSYLLLIAYTAILLFTFKIIFFPVEYYTEYHLEHKYSLSNQTFGKWLFEDLKGGLVGILIGLPLLIIFYWTISLFQDYWWIPFAFITFIVSVILAQIFPIYIIPLFYKISPVEDEELKQRIVTRSMEAGLNISNIFQFDMSKNTKKANAAFTGIGKTKRILLADTLLNNFTIDQVETVIAHELGHYKRKHIIKNIILSTINSFALFFVISILHSNFVTVLGFSSITQISSFPLIALSAILLSLVEQPFFNALSRKFEYEADEYAVKVTGKKEVFISTLDYLTDHNLGDREPNPIIEWLFYSHPSIKNRVNAINML